MRLPHYSPNTVVRRFVRESQRLRRLGHKPRCRRCGYPFAEALTKSSRGVLCYECQVVRAGTCEDHHVLGRAVDDALIVRVPTNMHRILSELQLSWSV